MSKRLIRACHILAIILFIAVFSAFADVIPFSPVVKYSIMGVVIIVYGMILDRLGILD